MQQDILLQSDKIYSVLSIILLIFGVLVGYLVVIERRLNRLEKKQSATTAQDKNENLGLPSK